MIGNKTANQVTQISKTSQQNSSDTVRNKHDKEIPKERYKCPEEIQKINGISNYNKFVRQYTKSTI